MVSYNANSDRTLIKFDMDGDGKADHTITVLGGDHTGFDNYIV